MTVHEEPKATSNKQPSWETIQLVKEGVLESFSPQVSKRHFVVAIQQRWLPACMNNTSSSSWRNDAIGISCGFVA